MAALDFASNSSSGGKAVIFIATCGASSLMFICLIYQPDEYLPIKHIPK